MAETETKESIGPCEACGLVDHHLVLGLCPGCRDKSTEIGEERGEGPDTDQ